MLLFVLVLILLESREAVFMQGHNVLGTYSPGPSPSPPSCPLPYPWVLSAPFLDGVSNLLASLDYVVICNVNAQEHTTDLQNPKSDNVFNKFTTLCRGEFIATLGHMCAGSNMAICDNFETILFLFLWYIYKIWFHLSMKTKTHKWENTCIIFSCDWFLIHLLLSPIASIFL